MTVLVSIDGRIVAPDEAAIPVFDRGFLYGDSIYEVIRTHGSVPFALGEHLERLSRSASLLQIRLPVDSRRIEEAVDALLARADHGDSYLRVIVTRGEGEITLDPGAARGPHWIVIMQPYRPLAADLVENGASVMLVRTGRRPGGTVPDGSKTGNYLMNIMALGRARSAGHHEAVLVTGDGLVAEGASSNIFVVRGGQVQTPGLSAGILAGITRNIVIGQCRRLGFEVVEKDLVPDELYGAEESFLTSTLRDVLAVVRVDARVIGTGRPGPATLRIREAYLEHVGRVVGRA
jgi:branched-chain amino acid aminotransferase